MTDDTAVPQRDSDDPDVRKPEQLRLLLPVVVAWCVLTIIASFVLYGQRPYVHKALIDANANAKTPKTDYVGAVVDNDVSAVLKYGLIQSVLVSFILVLVTFAVLRGRGWARWLLIGLATVLPILFGRLGVGVLFQLVLGVISSSPIVYKVPVVLAGLAALAVVVLLFLPEVRAYFAAVRAQEGTLRSRAFPPLAGGAPRPQLGLGSLFGARRRPGGPSGTGAPPVPRATTAPSAPGRSRVRTKAAANRASRTMPSEKPETLAVDGSATLTAPGIAGGPAATDGGPVAATAGATAVDVDSAPSPGAAPPPAPPRAKRPKAAPKSRLQ